MPALRVFFSCLGQALCAKGAKALAGLVPFGEVVYEVAAETLRRLRERHADARAGLQEAAAASPSDAAGVAAGVVRAEAAGQPAEVRDALAAYLAQVPGVL